MGQLRRGRRAGPEVAAFVLAAAGYAVAQLIGGRAPFGPVISAVNDMGDQFVPMHATLWDILHGVSDSDLFFTWSAAAGHPFLPDYVAYLSSPLNLALLVLVPRSGVEVAVTIGVLVRMGLAAALMTHVLRRLRPTLAGWVAVALGVGYGLGAWAVNDASYVPMWLDGFLGLPLILLAGQWARLGRRPILGILAVTWVWWSNFYSAYMATIGAVLLLALVMLADGDGPRAWLATAGRFAWRTAAGGLLAGLVLVPEMTAIGTSVTTTPTHVDDWLSFAPYVARLLPLTEGAGASPSLGFGTLPLLAALVVPLHPGLTRRQRIVLPLGVAALIVSTAHPTTYILWHLGIAPNGSAWREAFVIAAFGVVLAAYATSAEPLPSPARVLLPGGALLAAGWWVTGQEAGARLSTYSIAWAAGAVGVAVAAAAVARAVHRTAGSVDRAGTVRRVGGAPAPRRLAPALSAVGVVAVLVVVVAEQTLGAVVIAERRDVRLPGSYVWSAEDARVAPALAAWRAEGGEWPAYRTSGAASTGTNGQNDGLLYGVPSLTYYSSTMQQAVSTALTGLGAPYAASGRIIIATDDPGLNALFGVDGMLRRDGHVERVEALPVVRVLTEDAPAGATAGGTVFARRNALLGRPAYVEPELTATLGGRAVDLSRDLTLGSGDRLTVTASCPAGTAVQVYARGFVGAWTQLSVSDPTASETPRVTHAQPRDWHQRGVEPGVAEPDGTASLAFTAAHPGTLPAHPVSCLDTAELSAAVAAARAAQPQAASLRGSRMSIDLAAPTSGTLLIATARQDGWACTADGAQVAPQSRDGLFELPLTGQRAIRCAYTPPGLLRGAATSAIGLSMLLATALACAARRSRSRRTRRTRRIRSARGGRSGRSAGTAPPAPADLRGEPVDHRESPAEVDAVRRADADPDRAVPSPSPAR